MQTAVAGKDVSIRAEVTNRDATVPITCVLLHYRPIDQTRDWETRPMQEVSGAPICHDHTRWDSVGAS
ncbi:MAG: hypothetical protein CMJ62_13320 [Planctomycetaceae bacterium]|nr:hypothetical protein [Planctomycetaceae bacterium]